MVRCLSSLSPSAEMQVVDNMRMLVLIVSVICFSY